MRPWLKMTALLTTTDTYRLAGCESFSVISFLIRLTARNARPSRLYPTSKEFSIQEENHAGMLTLANCTLSGNRAIYGGGVFNEAGTLVLTNCTASNNIASHIGGGLYTTGGSIILQNSIIASGTDIDCYNAGWGTVSAFSSLIEDSGKDACWISPGVFGNIVGVNPLLGPLADNGGLTLTHALLWGSPAIDAGDNDLAVDPHGEPLTTDQRGAWRLWHQVDMGAYEAITFHYIMTLPEWVPIP